MAMQTNQPQLHQPESDLPPDFWKAWKPGDRQTWDIASSLDDPVLGMTFEQLTETFEPLGLPPIWSKELAQEYARATQLFLSLEIGRMARMRQSWSSKLRVLVAAVLTDVTGLALPLEPFASQYHAFRKDARWGWGSGPGGLAQLHSEQPFDHVGAPKGVPAWGPNRIDDFDSLDYAWAEAQASAGGGQMLPLLAVRACSCFAPSRRLLALDQMDDPVVVPSLWELIATAFFLGPSNMRTRGARFLVTEVSRPSSLRNGEVRSRSLATLEGSRGYLNGLFKTFAKAGGLLETDLGWRFAPSLDMPAVAAKRLAPRNDDRTAVPLTRYRRARHHLVARMEHARGNRVAVNAARSRAGTELRRLVLLDLLGQTGARLGEVLRLEISDYRREYRFLEDVVCPAVRITPSEKGSGRPIGPYWRPLHESTAGHIEALIDVRTLDEHQPFLFSYDGEKAGPISSSQGSADFSSAGAGNQSSIARGRGVIPLPDGSRGYSPSRVRHLVEALACDVGYRWLRVHREYADRVSPQVFADAVLTHRMSQDKLGYKDLEHHREAWAARAALGDPANGVPGIIDMVMGDAGLRRQWDLAAIRHAVRATKVYEQEIADAERDLRREQGRLRGLERQLAASAPGATQGAEAAGALEGAAAVEALKRVQALLVAEQRRGEIRDAIADASRAGASAREKRAEALLEHKATLQHLQELKDRGRTRPLADTEALPDELPPGEIPREKENWDQALERAELAHDVAAGQLQARQTEDETRLRLRHYLNPQELAAVCHVDPRTVSNWLAGKGAPFPVGGPKSPVISLASRLRAIAVERLPDDFIARLTPSQQELIDQLLLVPMGSTRWGGRSLDLVRLKAAQEAQEAGNRF